MFANITRKRAGKTNWTSMGNLAQIETEDFTPSLAANSLTETFADITRKRAGKTNWTSIGN
jgi:hypothetical protein